MIHPALIRALNHRDSACVLHPYYKLLKIFPCESDTDFLKMLLCQITTVRGLTISIFRQQSFCLSGVCTPRHIHYI